MADASERASTSRHNRLPGADARHQHEAAEHRDDHRDLRQPARGARHVDVDGLRSEHGIHSDDDEQWNQPARGRLPVALLDDDVSRGGDHRQRQRGLLREQCEREAHHADPVRRHAVAQQPEERREHEARRQQIEARGDPVDGLVAGRMHRKEQSADQRHAADRTNGARAPRRAGSQLRATRRSSDETPSPADPRSSSRSRATETRAAGSTRRSRAGRKYASGSCRPPRVLMRSRMKKSSEVNDRPSAGR